MWRQKTACLVINCFLGQIENNALQKLLEVVQNVFSTHFDVIVLSVSLVVPLCLLCYTHTHTHTHSLLNNRWSAWHCDVTCIQNGCADGCASLCCLEFTFCHLTFPGLSQGSDVSMLPMPNMELGLTHKQRGLRAGSHCMIMRRILIRGTRILSFNHSLSTPLFQH